MRWVVRVGALGGKSAADVAADLTDQHRQASEGHRRQPQAQVVAVVDVGAHLLKGDVLRPAIDVEVADGRIAVGATEDAEDPGLEGGPRAHRRRRIPAGTEECRPHGLGIADDHQIERVARLAAVGVGDGLRLFLHPLLESQRCLRNR